MSRKSTRSKKTKGAKVPAVVPGSAPFDVPEETIVVLNPQQALFMRLYYDRESPTWGNAKQSAIAAGFSEIYADQITYRKPDWWLGFARQQNLAGLIEEHFTEVMTLPTVMQAMGAFGPIFKTEVVKVEKKYKNGKTRMINKKIKVPVMVPNVAIIKEKTAVAKIAAPAHNPEMYGNKKPGGGNTFIFNALAARERYNGQQNA